MGAFVGGNELSPEKLNSLGDQYLRKGEKRDALECFYKAASRLHFGQREKKIAIYKKILKNAPSEHKAYEAIIALLGEMGLVAEEKRYLFMLAQLYQSKGEYNKMNNLFRRMREIDPESSVAEYYFRKGKQPLGEEGRPADLIPPEEAGRWDLPEPLDEAPVPMPDDPGALGQPDMEKDEARAVFEQPRAVEARLKEPPKRRVMLIGVAALLGIMLGIVLFMSLGRREDRAGVGRQASPVFSERKTLFLGTIGRKENAFEVTVIRLPAGENPGGVIADTEAKTHLLYEVTVKPVNGCIPDSFAGAPLSKISFLHEAGRSSEIKELRGLERLSRIVYKSNTCGRAQAPLFLKVFIAQEGNLKYNGLLMRGLENGGALQVQWTES